MSVLIILILASLAIAMGFLATFIWSVRNGQYENDYTPSIRMLFDDNKQSGSKNQQKTKKNQLINQ